MCGEGGLSTDVPSWQLCGVALSFDLVPPLNSQVECKLVWRMLLICPLSTTTRELRQPHERGRDTTNERFHDAQTSYTLTISLSLWWAQQRVGVEQSESASFFVLFGAPRGPHWSAGVRRTQHRSTSLRQFFIQLITFFGLD